MHLHHSFASILESTWHFELRDPCHVARLRGQLLRATNIWIGRCWIVLIGHSLGIWRDGWNVKWFDVFLERAAYAAVLVLHVLLSRAEMVRIRDISLVHRSYTRVGVVLELKSSLLIVPSLSMWHNTGWWRQIFILRYVILRHATCWRFQLTYDWRLFV